jgi:membrane protein
MPEESTALDPSGSGREIEGDQAQVAPPPVRRSPRIQALQGRFARFQKSAAGRFWSQLSAADFMNSSFAFAALAVLCAFPFLAVSSSVIGGDVRKALVARMGLNAKATRDVDALIATGNQAVAALTWVSAVVLVAGAIGMASTLQVWYHRIYEQTPSKRRSPTPRVPGSGGRRFHPLHLVRGVALRQGPPCRGRGLVFLLTFVFAVLFWWFSTYMLLYRKVPLRRLFPAGLATGICITGLGVFSALIFSGQITSGESSYGPAGVVLTLVSFLVGFGVCLHLGAVFGRMWNDWQDERASLKN